jgi:Fe-S cluster biogenesis protein NfuA
MTMADTLDGREFQAEMQRLDALLRGVERFTDPGVRAHVRALVRAVLDLHGTGLERLLGHVEAGGAAGRAILDACARDEVVAGLLLLHGLHPRGVEERVRQALDDVRPYLRSHGGGVELVGVNEGVVRLRLEGSCHGCPSSALTMKQTVEEAILARAPDVAAVEVEGMAEATPGAADDGGRVALPVL